MANREFTNFERKALAAIFAHSMTAVSRLREGALEVRGRTRSAFGLYVDLATTDGELWRDAGGEAIDGSFECAAQHPNGQDAIFCVLYVKAGRPLFIECSSTSDWPEQEDDIEFYSSG